MPETNTVAYSIVWIKFQGGASGKQLDQSIIQFEGSVDIPKKILILENMLPYDIFTVHSCWNTLKVMGASI